MAGIFNIHRTWEDWVSMVLGVLIGLSPWLAGQQGDQIVIWNVVIVGALVVALAALELAGLQRWEESGEIVCGLWLIVSPFIFASPKRGRSDIGISSLVRSSLCWRWWSFGRTGS